MPKPTQPASPPLASTRANQARAVLRRVGCAVALLVAFGASAEWRLNADASSMSFVSVKAGHLAEVHTIAHLSGHVSAAGQAQVSLHMASVDTAIEIRDERMRDHLFDVANHPVAQVFADVDMATLLALKPGSTTTADLSATLSFRESTLPLSLPVRISRLSSSCIQVTLTKQVIVNAATIDAVAGIEKLRTLAGLPSISNAVPVSFNLLFEHSPKPTGGNG